MVEMRNIQLLYVVLKMPHNIPISVQLWHPETIKDHLE